MRRLDTTSDDRLLLALHIQRKREFLLSIADRLDGLRFQSPQEITAELSVLPREIRSKLRDFDHLTAIEQQVQEYTSEFSRKLRSQFPELTMTEVLTCMYIYAGLKSSQIAAVQCVTTRAIEKHRMSIRKKLGLPLKANIQEFLEARDPAL
ncbi:hypothetical protein BH10BAC6_BH10BAC6_01890 [soil metagenome]